jgi:2-polyprenyl-3-methyl-5-hydroxy-6-metoxy-1,4-benzoquinol methylase
MKGGTGPQGTANPQEGVSASSARSAYQARYGFSYRVAERGPQFAAWIGTGVRVLDLGCRDGSLTQHYVTGNSVTGVDIDRQALALAQEKLGITTIQLDLNREQFPFEDGMFTVVVAGELLEHLVDPASMVNEVYRVLQAGGTFVGSVPNSFHWRARLAFVRGRSIEDPAHLQLFSRDRLRHLLQRFAAVELVPVGGIGGRALPIVPAWLAQPIVRGLPTLFANDFLFRATKPLAVACPANDAGWSTDGETRVAATAFGETSEGDHHPVKL